MHCESGAKSCETYYIHDTRNILRYSKNSDTPEGGIVRSRLHRVWLQDGTLMESQYFPRTPPSLLSKRFSSNANPRKIPAVWSC